MKMFDFHRNLTKIRQVLTSSVTPFGVPPSPKGKAYLPDKRESAKGKDALLLATRPDCIIVQGEYLGQTNHGLRNIRWGYRFFL